MWLQRWSSWSVRLPRARSSTPAAAWVPSPRRSHGRASPSSASTRMRRNPYHQGALPAGRLPGRDVRAPWERFDLVVSTEVIEHLYPPELLVRFARESLDPGGRLIVTTPHHGYWKNLALAATGKWTPISPSTGRAAHQVLLAQNLDRAARARRLQCRCLPRHRPRAAAVEVDGAGRDAAMIR